MEEKARKKPMSYADLLKILVEKVEQLSRENERLKMELEQLKDSEK